MGTTGVIGVVAGEVLALGVDGDLLLYGDPGGLVDERLAVVVDNQVGETQLADIEGVSEECFVGIGGTEQAGFVANLAQGLTSGAHGEGFLDGGNEIGIRDPAVADVGTAVAALADFDGLADEAAWGCARDAAIGEHQVTQAALDVTTEVVEEALVGPVQGGFEENALGAFGQIVGNGDDAVATSAHVSAVELGVVDVAGEAGPAPDDEAGYGCVMAQVVDHGQEAVSIDGGGTGTGVVAVGFCYGQAMGEGVALDFGELLVGAQLLGFTARITEVGDVGFYSLVFMVHAKKARIIRSSAGLEQPFFFLVETTPEVVWVFLGSSALTFFV